MGRQKLDMRPYAAEAAAVLGSYIRQARVERRMTLEQLAANCHISRRTLSQIEHGDGSCSFGHVLNACTVLGIELFGADRDQMQRLVRERRTVVALLPSRVVPMPLPEVDDDF